MSAYYTAGRPKHDDSETRMEVVVASAFTREVKEFSHESRDI